MSENKGAISLLLEQPTINRDTSRDSFTLAGRVVRVDDHDTIRNGVDEPTEDLGITFYGWEDGGFSLHVEYQRPYCVTLPKAEQMVKTLRGVHRKMEAQRKKYGYTQDATEAVMRMIHAIGVKVLVERISNGGGDYDSGEYRFRRDFEAMAGHIRQVLETAYEQVRPAKPQEIEQTSQA